MRPETHTTKIAFLGCGYVANMYRLSLPLHDQLQCVGVYDLDSHRAERMASAVGCRAYLSLQELLSDDAVEIVLNLTDPQSHYESTKACLQADKHVYTEKPLAMSQRESFDLTQIATAHGVQLSSAPCTLFSQAAQTLWHAIKDGSVGKIRLIYAEMEDGMVHRMPTQRWINEMGVPWPTQNEFETGCTIEHAGYVLSWLVAFFGPVASVTAFSDTLVSDKIPGTPLAPADDFSVGCLRFQSGVVARLTCGLFATHDHRLRLFGDEGILTVSDPRCDDSPVYRQRYLTIRRARKLNPFSRKMKPVGPKARYGKYRGSQRRDFLRGVADMAAAIDGGTKQYLSADFCLHVNEIVLALQYAGQQSTTVHMTSTFEPLVPLKQRFGKLENQS